MAISAEFTADFTQFERSVASATANATRAFSDFARELTSFATEYISAFAEEEAATARLEQALRNTGSASTEVIAAYGQMATQFQETTRYSDDAIVKAQELFTTIGNVGPAQMQPAIEAAADLASGMGIDLEEAATLMAKALGSGGDSLGRLKQILGDSIEKGAGFEEIMAAINAKFGGQAAADMETTAGKLVNLNNKFEEFKGKVGEALATALTPFLDAFLRLSPELQTVIAGVAGLVAALVPVGIALAGFVTAIGPVIAAIGGAGGLAAAFSAILPFLGPVGLIAAGVAAVYLAFRNWDKIVEIAKMVYEGIKFWLVESLSAIFKTITNPIGAVIDGFKWMYNQVVGHSIVPEMIDGIGAQFDRLDEEMVRPTLAAAERVSSAMAQLTGPQITGGGKLPAGIANVREVEAFGGRYVEDVRTGQMLAQLERIYGASGFLGWGYKTLAESARVNNIIINGSVLSNKDEIARVVGDALTSAYGTGGNRLPI